MIRSKPLADIEWQLPYKINRVFSCCRRMEILKKDRKSIIIIRELKLNLDFLKYFESYIRILTYIISLITIVFHFLKRINIIFWWTHQPIMLEIEFLGMNPWRILTFVAVLLINSLEYKIWRQLIFISRFYILKSH